jgi:molybdate transport system substrate-binding protein
MRRLLLALLLLMVQPAAGTAQESRPVLVFAAASLQTALAAIADAWRRETGRRVTVSYAATPALARQLEHGAPADLLAFADADWMDFVERRGLLRAGTRRSLLGNTLVLIEPADRPAAPLTIGPGFALARALGDSRLAIAHPETVPAGRYARAALESLGVWSAVRPRVAGTDNVRAALALVARGEARFGIVYGTDARTEPRVRVVGEFPATSHPPILYPFAVTATSTHPDAQALLEYLRSPAAIRVFEAEGFLIIR